MPEPTYVVSASHPDGSPYRDSVDQALHHDGPSTVAAYGDADRDARVSAIEAAGLTAHVRQGWPVIRTGHRDDPPLTAGETVRLAALYALMAKRGIAGPDVDTASLQRKADRILDGARKRAEKTSK